LTMKELQVKVLEVKPAVVSFNFEEMLNVAKKIKAQYEGLIFAEETVKQGKKTVAELKKIQKSVNDFKIKTKEELTQSVSVFENQCKTIIAEFDEPINFITTQLNEYEKKRIEGKTNVINGIIERLKEESQIEEKFYNLEWNPKWTNKTFGTGEITEEATYQLNNMIIKQNEYYTKLEIIQAHVELANAKYNLNVPLSEKAFYSLVEYKTPQEIKEIILQTGEHQHDKEIAYAEKVRADEERKANVKAAKTVAKAVEQINDFVPVEKEESDPILTTSFRIKGTRAQFDAIKRYILASGVEIL
jgi:hypothetical protein